MAENIPANRGESSYPEKGPKAVYQKKGRNQKELRRRKSLLHQDKEKSRMEDDQIWSHRILEVTQFTEGTRSKRLLEKVRIPDNVQP